MLAMIAAAMLSSPLPLEPACDENGWPLTAQCRSSCAWWSKAEKRCRDVDVEVIGSWDPRPAPHEWSSGYSMPEPSSWPAYPLEKANSY